MNVGPSHTAHRSATSRVKCTARIPKKGCFCLRKIYRVPTYFLEIYFQDATTTADEFKWMYTIIYMYYPTTNV